MVLVTPSQCLRGRSRSPSNNRNFPRSQAEGLVGLQAPSRWNLLNLQSRQSTKADQRPSEMQAQTAWSCASAQPSERVCSAMTTRRHREAPWTGHQKRPDQPGRWLSSDWILTIASRQRSSFPKGDSPVGRWISTIKLPCLPHSGVVWLSARKQIRI